MSIVQHFPIEMLKSNQIKNGLTSGSSSNDDIRDVPDSMVTLAGHPNSARKTHAEREKGQRCRSILSIKPIM